MAAMSSPVMAGGLLTNTNQNATFLRNPARDAAIAIDGVYSNPAGVAFLPQGFHLSVSWQAAFQKRQLNASNDLFMMNANNPSKDRYFEGKAVAPVIPSFQAAYVFNDKWSVSAQFAVGGGGGKCEFDEGLPMFEELLGGSLASGISGATNPGAPYTYSLNQSLTGKQFFYGIQVGGTYKVTDNVSVFGGLRGVLASGSYKGAITDFTVNNLPGTAYSQTFAENAQKLQAAAQQFAAAGDAATAAKYAEMAQQAGTVAVMTSSDLVLDCAQSGFGITPIIGVDYKLGKLNLAAKYEFRTKINMENESYNSKNVDAAFNVYADGNKVRSDIPSLLTVGAQYEFTPAVRAMGGFHYYWDKKAKGTAIKEGDNTWEVTLGAEWDVNDKILLSLGGQRTQYGFADSDMGDIHFNIRSTALCIGGAYKFTEDIKLNIGYMHSFYEDYKFTNAANTNCNYTRKNDVIGASLDLRF